METMKTLTIGGNTYEIEDRNAREKAILLEGALDGKAPIAHTEDQNNPHKVTAAQVGARPNTWTPTAEQVGARPDTWTPTAEEVGARPDTWTPTAAEVGAAPAGYGIGKLENHEVNTDNDIDSVLTSQIIGMDGQTFKRIVLSLKAATNFTGGGGHYYADIYKLSTNYAMITIKSYIQGGRTMQRTWFEGALTPWEWLNPPMTPGVEYRTVERYNGKVVYAMTVNAGGMVASGTMPISISGAADINIVRYVATMGGHALPLNAYGVWTDLQVLSTASLQLRMRCDTASLVGGSVKVYMWYTKD